MSAESKDKAEIKDVEVRNYMRVKRARITLDGNTFVIAGDNGAGKSSFITAIQDAFGGSKFAPAMPIRKGASESTTLITLSDGTGRVLKAEVVHSKTGRRLTVKDAEGKALGSPQAIMDAFWAETSFDPSLFLISKREKQVEMLKRMGGLDFTKLDAEHDAKFVERTGVNKEAIRLDAVAASKTYHSGAPEAEVNSAAIIDRIRSAEVHNAAGVKLYEAIGQARRECDSGKKEIETTAADIAEIQGEIERLQQRLKVRNDALASATAKYSTLQNQLGEAIKEHAAFKPIETAPLNDELNGLEENNRKVRANAERAKARKEAETKKLEADRLTDRLNEIEETKREMIRTAKFPIEGMSIDGDDVTINGIPLEQEADSRRLAIGVEMAAAMNPGKPLMLVRHGNLFTPENFSILEEIATRRNLTCIVEIPGKSVAGAKLVFEDGVGTEQLGAQQELATP